MIKINKIFLFLPKAPSPNSCKSTILFVVNCRILLLDVLLLPLLKVPVPGVMLPGPAKRELISMGCVVLLLPSYMFLSHWIPVNIF